MSFTPDERIAGPCLCCLQPYGTVLRTLAVGDFRSKRLASVDVKIPLLGGVQGWVHSPPERSAGVGASIK